MLTYLNRIMGEEQWVQQPLSTLSSSPQLYELCDEKLQDMTISTEPKGKKQLSGQLSMRQAPREKAWERRRKQILKQGRRKNSMNDLEDLTDADLHELKGCIELGFGFNEEDGQKLCNTLPALDLYFAVNRQAVGSIHGTTVRAGDDPEQVKTKLRHWAQAVACSVMQYSY